VLQLVACDIGAPRAQKTHATRIFMVLIAGEERLQPGFDRSRQIPTGRGRRPLCKFNAFTRRMHYLLTHAAFKARAEIVKKETPKQGIQSVEHAMRLLEVLVAERAPQTLKSLSESAQMTASTAHRYLVSLGRARMVQQDPANGKYELSTFALRLGLAALGRANDIEIANRHLQEVVLRHNIDGHISVWGDFGPTIVRIQSASGPLLTNLRLGAVLPLLTSATGRTFLTYMPDAMLEPVLTRETNRHGPLSAAARAAVIEQTKSQGAATADNQLVAGMRSIAVPVFDMQHSLRAVIALVGPSPSLIEFPNPVASDLILAGRRASQDLGST